MRMAEWGGGQLPFFLMAKNLRPFIPEELVLAGATRIKMSYEEPKAGQWVQPVYKGYKMACCDCGLVHVLDFRVYKGRVQFRAFRHARATAGMRSKGSNRLIVHVNQ